MKKFFKSIVVGASLVIPGVCSATTSIILGVYEDMLAVFSNLFRFSKLKKYFVICLGLMIGLILGVSVIKILYDKIPFISNMVFFGVIISLFPYRIKQKRHINKILYFIISVIGFSLVIVLSMNFESSIAILEDSLSLKHYILIFISGLIASISLVLPGISGALMLVVLGLYMPLLESLRLMVDCLINFKLPQIENLMFILVFFTSFIISLIGSSKIIDKFINRNGKLFEALINGMMLGSIVNMMGIIALLEAGLIEILIGLILYAILVLYLKLIVA